MSHTPGPWSDFNHSWCETSIVAPSFDHAICRLDINHATEESQESDEAVMAANARLISLAPELLDCLRHTVRFWDQLNAHDIENMRALIARATGETA